MQSVGRKVAVRQASSFFEKKEAKKLLSIWRALDATRVSMEKKFFWFFFFKRRTACLPAAPHFGASS
jgi:hypothetical protein